MGSEPGAIGPLGGHGTLTSGPRAQGLLTIINFCQAGFSDLLTNKTKPRNRLDARNDNCLAQSETEPNITGLLK